MAASTHPTGSVVSSVRNALAGALLGPQAAERDATPTGVPAEVYQFIYQEALRSLTQQASVLDNLRGRAGLLLTAANVATAFLATTAVTARSTITPGGWLAIGAFVAAAILSVIVVMPQGSWNFSFKATDMIAKAESEPDKELTYYHRRLAQLNDDSYSKNQMKIDRLLQIFSVACVVVVVEIVLWVLVLGEVVLGPFAF